GQIVQRRILDGEVTLPHRALDVDYRVARRAAQSVLRFGSIDLFFYWAIKPPVEEHRVIVTACAPFRRASADYILHVLDRFSVPLIVERPEMMRRRIPLIVDVFVTASALFAGHEKCRGDRSTDVCFGR